MEKKDIKELKEVVARFNSNWRYKELLTFIDGLLDKAREEVLQRVYDFVEKESGKSGRKEILEYIEELSKLKQ